ncbi:MAG TPA: YitT family protein [Chitinophagaceae bacterium]|nr:YitT family protein [Chitinophagaceae bacterium]
MQFDNVYSYLMPRLESELPSYLTYHDARHTKEVLRDVQHLAKKEAVSENDFTLLSTAALFHDAGFLEVGYNDHEELSCKIAKSILPDYNYSEEQIEQINNMIMATKLPQTPTTKLEKILCDADLYYLGTENYFRIAEKLYNEWKETGFIKTKEEWKQKQISFLEAHQYFTKTANEECSVIKHKNLIHLKSHKGPRAHHHKKNNWVNGLQDAMLIILGVLSAGFGLMSFLVPSHFIDGGVTGIALIVTKLYGYDLALTTFVLNLPFVFVSYFTISRSFAVKTFIGVSLLSICLLYFPYPVFTTDKLLVAFFGGFFIGVGSGLVLRAGCLMDGIDVMALYTFKKTSFTVTEIILLLNIIIFFAAAFVFGREEALYSILTYFTATKTIDYVVEGIEEYTGVTIISGHSEIIKYRLVNELGRGITIYKGERGFLPENFEVSSKVDIIFTVVTRLELRRLKNLVYDADPKAFVFANSIKDASGGILRRRSVH